MQKSPDLRGFQQEALSPTFLKILVWCLHRAYTVENGKRQDIQEGHR